MEVDNKVLTTKELSQYLKLNEKTILKMAQTGELPGFKIANQWRFYLSTIDEFLQDRILRSSAYDFKRLVDAGDVVSLSRLVDKPYIELNLNSRSKDEVLQELAAIAESAGLTGNKQSLYEQLVKREEMLSTAVEGGIAVPHPRNPNDELFNSPGVVIGRSIEGIDFAAADAKKTHLFFMTCATDVVLHLKLLAKIARLLRNTEMFKKFMRADSKQETIRILLEFERKHMSALTE